MYDETEEILVAVERLPADERKRVSALLFAVEDEALSVGEPTRTHALLARHEFVSVEDYLEFEEESRIRHEYVAGRIFAMTGTTRAHNRIVGNVYSAMKAHLRGGPCVAYFSELKTYIKVGSDEFYYYPDVVVSCGARGETPHRIDDATLVVEVLSPSTHAVDRREKRLNYPHIETLQEYVLIGQRSPEITFHRRTDGWRPHACTSPREAAEFQSIQLTVPLLQVYEGVF